MRRVIVRYRVKPDRVAEHEALLAEVFTGLAAVAPPDLQYGAFKQADGVSFVHVAFIAGPKNPLDDLPAFRAFGKDIRDRCDDPPVVTELSAVGAYRL